MQNKSYVTAEKNPWTTFTIFLFFAMGYGLLAQ